MSTLFQSYEEEYRDTVKTINESLSSLRASLQRGAANYSAPPATGAGSRVQRGAQLLSLMHQVKELLNNMEYESNDVPPPQRPALRERLSECRRNTRALEEEMSKVRTECAAADRIDLMGGAKGDASSAPPGTGALDAETAKQRMTMMQNTEKAKQASQTLTRAERLLLETEETGTEALQNLRTQTEAMHRIHSTTVDVNEEISEARKILTGMHRTMIKHKITLICIIIVLLFLIFVAIYVSVAKHSREKVVVPTQQPTSVPTLPTVNPNSGGGIPSD